MAKAGAARDCDAARKHAPARERVLVIACGALAREIVALIRVNRLDHITVRCITAYIHHHPERIPDAVRAAIAKARGEFDQILVAFADCGTGGLLDKVLEEEGVGRIGGPHCYAFFSGLEDFGDGSDDMTSFFLTDFSVRQFDSFVVKPLGLDRHPDLRDMYFGNYEKVVYLAQTDDAELDRRARVAADRLGLAYERRLTGYGDLAGFVAAGALERTGRHG